MKEIQVHGLPIAVHDTYLIYWDTQHNQTQIRFLDTFDPSYFTFQSRTLETALEGPDSNQAALALRSNYSHALESMFTLIGAAVQAYHCPAGWILSCSNSALRGLLTSINTGEKVPNLIGMETPSWQRIAEKLLITGANANWRGEHIESVGRFWGHLARTFVDQTFTDEYNSIKHGLRVRSTASVVAIGFEDTPGVAAPANNMHVVASSVHGSNILQKHLLSTRQWTVKDQRIDWDPSDFVDQMPLIVRSVENVLDFLKAQSGHSIDSLGTRFISRQDVNSAFAREKARISATFSPGPRVSPNSLKPLSLDEIRINYEQTAHSLGELRMDHRRRTVPQPDKDGTATHMSPTHESEHEES